MVALTEEYLADEALLAPNADSSGSGAAMLGLIGFEIYLKSIAMSETGHRPRNHDFLTIWKSLPVPVRRELLADAKTRFTVHADFRDIDRLFAALKKAFEKGRYLYEANDDRTDADTKRAGEDWISEGAALETADIAYYPLERAALIWAFRRYWQAQELCD
ncbi:hypothetical protein [uncultured Roseobacter sp.]|uniref:hypothetical protein n=1 Tax=uncultured Roseobacter sp. TaxID=114847 RepID=UPI00260624A7|nr:hypothetical protein [uncultured Roseobacter sp.]